MVLPCPTQIILNQAVVLIGSYKQLQFMGTTSQDPQEFISSSSKVWSSRRFPDGSAAEEDRAWIVGYRQSLTNKGGLKMCKR